MSFTLIHGLIPYTIVSLLTKDKRLRLMAFIAGMLPDLDGIPILFNQELYYQIHHELLHMPLLGVIFSIPLAFAVEKYYKIEKWKTIVVFSGAYLLHGLTDVFFSNWYVKLLWPISMQKFSYPISELMTSNRILALAVLLFIFVQFIWFIKKLRKKNLINKNIFSKKNLDKIWVELWA